MALTGWNRLQLIGDFNDGQSWSCGFNFGTDAGDAGMTTEDQLAAWATAIKALNDGSIVGGDMETALSNRARITTIKCSYITAAAGKEAAQAQILLGTPLTGSTPPALPQEVAVTLSLLTAHPGRQNRGRVYWPALGLQVQGTARFSATVCIGLATGCAQFLADVALASPGDDGETTGNTGTASIRPAIISKSGAHATPITEVAVGDVPDSQRRRRDKEKETYSVHAVTQ